MVSSRGFICGSLLHWTVIWATLYVLSPCDTPAAAPPYGAAQQPYVYGSDQYPYYQPYYSSQGGYPTDLTYRSEGVLNSGSLPSYRTPPAYQESQVYEDYVAPYSGRRGRGGGQVSPMSAEEYEARRGASRQQPAPTAYSFSEYAQPSAPSAYAGDSASQHRSSPYSASPYSASPYSSPYGSQETQYSQPSSGYPQAVYGSRTFDGTFDDPSIASRTGAPQAGSPYGRCLTSQPQ